MCESTNMEQKVFKNELSGNVEVLKQKRLEDIEVSMNNQVKLETEGGQSMAENKYTNFHNENGKIYVKRKSLLSKLLRDSHLNSLYNIILSMFIFFYAFIYFDGYRGNREIPLKIHIDFWLESDKVVLPYTWLKMFAYSLMIYPITYFHYKARGSVRMIWSSIYVLFCLHFSYFSCQLTTEYSKTPISTGILSIEFIRLTMKNHSFFRENSRFPDANTRSFSTLWHFLYFSFAPTLIYRDSYPRKKTVNLVNALSQVVQFALCIALNYIIIEHVFVLYVNKNISDKMDLITMITEAFRSSVPGTVILLTSFFAFLHCWLNIWAEVLRFGDRLFYLDWWNATCYSDYYKKWNIVVHDWLKTYVFDEIKGKNPNSRKIILASCATIIISAVTHEFIMVMISKSFCPMYIFSFGIIGVILKFVDPNRILGGDYRGLSNFMLWLSFMFGSGLLVMLYTKENQMAFNCPLKQDNKLMFYLLPRFLDPSCYIKQN